jgi:hypothetical protein
LAHRELGNLVIALDANANGGMELNQELAG